MWHRTAGDLESLREPLAPTKRYNVWESCKLVELFTGLRASVVILENGIGMDDTVEADDSIHDHERMQYLHDHLVARAGALDDGHEVLECTWWGPIDIVSAGMRRLSASVRACGARPVCATG